MIISLNAALKVMISGKAKGKQFKTVFHLFYTCSNLSGSLTRIFDALNHPTSPSATSRIPLLYDSSTHLVTRSSLCFFHSAYPGRFSFDEKTAGFVLDPANEHGPAVFIRDAWAQSVTRDGTTKVDVYNGRTKAATGALLFYADNYYISLDKPELAASLAVGSTFRIKK